MLRRQSGYSLIEFLMASGVALILGLAVYGVLTQSTKVGQKLVKKIDMKIDSNMGKRVLIKDLKIGSPSLNNLALKDDANLNFFDFDPDKSGSFFRSQKVLSRTLTLKKGGKAAFYLIVGDESLGKALFVEPINFFDMGVSPPSISEPATLTYKGLNYNNYLGAKAPNLLDDSKLLIADSSSLQYVVDPAKDIARPAVFLGRVKTGATVDLEPVTLPDDLFSYTIRNPGGKVVNPNNFESFLLNLPPAGTNGASIRIRSVKLIKYELVCPDSKCELVRKDISALNPKLESQYTVDRDVTRVVFSREDISTNVFKFEVFKD